MTTELHTRLRSALIEGRPRDAVALLREHRPGITDVAIVLAAAEAFAAVGRPRRAAALLVLATRRLNDVTLARAAARAVLEHGLHRRARMLLEPHASDPHVAVLHAIARHEPLPLEPQANGDIDDELDLALAQPTSTQRLRALFAAAPDHVRARLAVAARLRHDGDGDGARALLRAGLKGREDARLEVLLAASAIDDGAFDEAALVLARARARHIDLARRSDLRLLLSLVTAQAGRRDDAISMLRGAERSGVVERAALAMLEPSAAPTTTTTTAPVAAIGHAAAGEVSASRRAWTGPVVSPVDPTPPPPSWMGRAALGVVVLAVLLVGGKKLLDRFATHDVRADAGTPINDEVTTAFSERVDRCGIAWPAVYEPGLLYAEVAGRLIADGFNGQAVVAGDLRVTLDPALAFAGPDVEVRVLHTNAPTAPGVLVVDDNAVGIATVATNRSARPEVGSVVQLGRMGLTSTKKRACAIADPGSACVVARTTCQDLEITLSAICPEAATEVASLGTCAFDAVLVRPIVGAAADAGVVVDAGAIADAGAVVDAGTVIDAGAVDAGVVDAGAVDAGVVDAGVVDAGAVDAGVVDAGAVDAGVVDAGAVDAGP